jgi:sugar (pentulose or hexulose) kinase
MLGIALRRVDGATHGPALGAARLAQAALTGEPHFPRPAAGRVFEPRGALAQRYDEAHARWASLYRLAQQVPAARSE